MLLSSFSASLPKRFFQMVPFTNISICKSFTSRLYPLSRKTIRSSILIPTDFPYSESLKIALKDIAKFRHPILYMGPIYFSNVFCFLGYICTVLSTNYFLQIRKRKNFDLEGVLISSKLLAPIQLDQSPRTCFIRTFLEVPERLKPGPAHIVPFLRKVRQKWTN